jgi:hypothetical protein
MCWIFPFAGHILRSCHWFFYSNLHVCGELEWPSHCIWTLFMVQCEFSWCCTYYYLQTCNFKYVLMNVNDPSHRFHFVLSLGGQWAHIWTLTSNSLRLPHFSSQCLWWLLCFRYISYSSGMCELSQFPSNAMPRANQVPFSISILWRNLTMFQIMQIYSAICEQENLANFLLQCATSSALWPMPNSDSEALHWFHSVLM